MPHPTATKMTAIIKELGDEFFERREHIEALLIADLAGQHTFLLGPPGTGKSLLVRATNARYTGAQYWETLFDRQLPMETIFGPIDILEFERSGNWHRRTEGYLPTAHKAFGDEVGRAGPAVLNPLLTLLNERLYHNNSTPTPVPLISFVGASNELLEPELAAVWDRFLIRMIVAPIQEPSNFAALLASAVVKPVPVTPTTISLAELRHAMDVEVPAVTLPPGVIDTILQLRVQLRAEQIEPSDRRWKQCVRLLQASAYLNGRSAVDEDDLAILRHVLWDVVEQIPTVERRVLSLTSPMTKAALEFAGQLDDINTELNARRGQALESKAAYGGTANFKLTEIAKKLNDLIEDANRKGRSTARLEAVKDQLRATKVAVFVTCMNMPPERAKLMGDA
jgi:MoxR-like ATPase